MNDSETDLAPETTAVVAPATPAPTPAAAPAFSLPALPESPLWSVGRRKKATARIRFSAGTGKVSVNGRTLDAFFPDAREIRTVKRALEVLHSLDRYDVVADVYGGGLVGQSGALALGIARALVRCDPTVVPTLRAAGLLTRDARVKERKKYGRRGARRGFQFSKR